MSNILFKQMTGQVNIDEAEGIVECFVAGIGNKDSVGDICAPGSFNASLRRRTPRVVWGHDWNQPIGKVLEIYEVGANDPRLPKKMKAANIGGLYARVQFNLKSERGREAFASVSFFGMDQEWSIGYKTLDAVFDNARQANILKEVELYEVSPVLHGANQLTGTISIKSDSAVLDPVEEKASKKPIKDPDGGLTAAGREYFKRTEGANLKPGVKGPADTPEKMRRKGSFLTRFFTNPSGPMVGDNGKPTRLALSAAAWGEPVPKNAEDAAELAAKGRRLLERYKNQKEKDAKGHGGEYGSSKPERGEKFMGMLARAIANEMDAPVKIRTAEDNMVVFDIMRDGQKQTFRMAYHDDDGDFMFGRSERVKPETVYLPMGEVGPGHAFSGDEKSAEEDFADWIEDMIDFAHDEDEFGSKIDEEALSAIAELVSSDIEVKVGRVLSGSNLEKLNQAIGLLREIAAAGGREDIEMKTPDQMMIPAEQKNLFELRMHLDPIFDHYGASVICEEGGIRVKSLSGDLESFEAAVSTALGGFRRPFDLAGGQQEKALFRRAKRGARRAGIPGGGGRGKRKLRGGAPDKPAYDGDNDGFITNPLTGRDEIPWNKDTESPEEAINKFFRRGGATRKRGLTGKPIEARPKQRQQAKPKAKPLSDKERGVEALAGFDKIKLGDTLPDNWDDPTKKLGAPRWQIIKLSRMEDGRYQVTLGDLSMDKPGGRKTVVFAGDEEFPNVSRPYPTPAARGVARTDREGRPKPSVDAFEPEDGMTPPFDPSTRKPATGKPKKKPTEPRSAEKPGEQQQLPGMAQQPKLPERTFNWPKDDSNQMLPIERLTDDDLQAAVDYWNSVPDSAVQGQGIRNLRESLVAERKRRRDDREQAKEPDWNNPLYLGTGMDESWSWRSDELKEEYRITSGLYDNDPYEMTVTDLETGDPKVKTKVRSRREAEQKLRDRYEKRMAAQKPNFFVEAIQRIVNWKGYSNGSPSGTKAYDYGRGEYGRYWIVDAGDFGGTPGKYIIDGP
jgi:HK97 family phage prohead protease